MNLKSTRHLILQLTLLLSLSFFTVQTASSQGVFTKSNPLPEFLKGQVPWADSMISNMTLDEKIGQLFMVAAYSNKGPEHMAELKKLVEENHIGGLIFFKGTPYKQAQMTNELQELAKVPLMIAMDAEWGMSMRLDSTMKYPKQMTLGAIQNDTLIYTMGSVMADELHRMGVQVNFAPVVDVNNNPDNPVIGYRSFGENRYNVARKGMAYMQGLQDGHIFTTAKHFPGHGDTDTDSHLDLPIIDKDIDRLDSLELFPFRYMMARKLAGVMVAHLHIPALDSTPNQASTLSPLVVKKLLREDMGFRGLAFTDALNMKGVAKYYEPGEVDLKALIAGNDVLLFPEDVPKAVKKIREAIDQGIIRREEINAICYRILKAKNWMGLKEYKPIALQNLTVDINNDRSKRVRDLLYENALTVLENKNNHLPYKVDQKQSLALITVGGKGQSFYNELAKYGDYKRFNIASTAGAADIQSLSKKLKNFDRVLVAVHGLNNNPKKDFGFKDQTANLIDVLQSTHETDVVYFGNPYGLKKLKEPSKLASLTVTYEDNEITQKLAAKMLYGYAKANGKLPVSVGDIFNEGDGLSLNMDRVYDVLPEEIGLSSFQLSEIDSIVQHGLDEKAYPGCVVMAAKDGKIFYNKAFGYHTYDEDKKVQKDDIYDLASITKIVATMASVMKLQQENKLDVNKTLGDYLTVIHDTSDYKGMVLKDVLTHQAGLIPWIPFYLKTLEKGEPNPEYYSAKKDDTFNVKVANDLYIHQNQSDTLLLRILSSRTRDKKDYKYSDLGYYFLKEIVEEITKQPFEEYVAENFYMPLGLSTMGYHPLQSYGKDRIVPTEYDMYFRKQKVHGYVHDPGAAMQGGVGGHAGVFSSGRDLLTMMQMYLDYGKYDGVQYLDSTVIAEFTDCQFCTGDEDENRRGIGFDKPNRHNGPGPTCDCVSFASFGHSGFTGTLAWADPEENITYVFLSNRIYPSADNKKLIKMNIRTRIMEVIYSALDQSEGAVHVNNGLKM